ARGADKAPLAKQLGAAVYIDSQSQNPAAELQKLGGAAAILATATNAHAMAAVQGGLAVHGTLLGIRAVPLLQVDSLLPLSGCRSIKAGTPAPRSTRKTHSGSVPAPA